MNITNNRTIPFIVEDGFNTSYIDTLLMALFYKPSYIQDILSDTPSNPDFIYLQELIYQNFVCNIRCHFSVDASTINEIRNYMFLCGWQNEYNITDQYNVNELYSFLINGFNSNKIKYIDDNKNETHIDYIECHVDTNTNTKILIEKHVNEITDSKLIEIPKYIPLFLNRKNNFDVDIKYGINLKNNILNDDEKLTLWTIHSIICLPQNETKHYYSIIYDRNEWYYFDNTKLPSLIKIDIKNEDIALKIKKESIFILYSLDC
ncbi:hypothetical protein BMW23_0823 [Bodo saltans virus]|uniref:USP domain-containing protein n=1 Tax=Bodo saltans virus TaxID=2024608 RepID=A0A2H4UVH8_9VIRU|nr:hypothetical protein QJ851_gp0806 [Bodo saltans virus]ATZ80869.1 hypothetical protein BMW23_0823 [Bodo saltans virus]